MHSDRSPPRFVLVAGITFAILVGAFEASRGSGFERFVVESLILAPTERLIDLWWPGDHVILIGRTFISGTTRLNVTRGCEGVEMFLMLGAAILAWPGSFRMRLAGLLIGFVLAYCLSVARLMVLVYTLRHAPHAWESLHGLILPLAPVLILASGTSSGGRRRVRLLVHCRAMRSDWRWVLAFAAVLSVAAMGATSYARLAAPCYRIIAGVLALGHPWDVVSVEVTEPSGAAGAELRLKGLVYESSASFQPLFRMTGKLQVAAAAQVPLIFWTVLALWPAATLRRRLSMLCLGVPVFVLLETATTVCQLMNPLAYASAVLAGARDPLTAWECWSRFLEDGGRVGLALVAAALVATGAARLVPYRTHSSDRAVRGARRDDLRPFTSDGLSSPAESAPE